MRRRLLLLLTAISLYGQAGTATITGTVTDPTGAAVLGAKITVREPATGFVRETTSNETGNYSLPGLRLASYHLTAESSGFRRHSQTGFRVEVDQIARLDIRLELGQVTEQVEVTGTAQLLHSESSTIGSVIDKKRILELPLNGRNFVQLALVMPALQSTGRTTWQPSRARPGDPPLLAKPRRYPVHAARLPNDATAACQNYAAAVLAASAGAQGILVARPACHSL